MILLNGDVDKLISKLLKEAANAITPLAVGYSLDLALDLQDKQGERGSNQIIFV